MTGLGGEESKMDHSSTETSIRINIGGVDVEVEAKPTWN